MLTQGPTPDPKCKFIISSFLIRLSHLCQEYHAHCVVIADGGGMGWVGLVDLYYGVGGGTGGFLSSYTFCFFVVLLYFVASPSQSLCLGG